MLNKIYLAIKAWIILQLTNFKNWWLSLFNKKLEQDETSLSELVVTVPQENDDLQENDQQPSDTIPGSPLPEGNTISVPPPPGSGRISIPPPPGSGRISVPPPPGSGVVLPITAQQNVASTTWNESMSTVNTNGEESASPLESGVLHMSLPSEPVVSLYDRKYDYLFSTIETETTLPSSVVNEEIWNVLKERLPEDYSIPVSTSKMLYKRNY